MAGSRIGTWGGLLAACAAIVLPAAPVAAQSGPVEKGAKIAANHGGSFGLGGDSFLRFNLATPRAVVEDAVQRLQKAFSDLQ